MTAPARARRAFVEMLATHGALATFLPCGVHVERLPAVVRAVVEAGHEIGNHGYTPAVAASLGQIHAKPTWSGAQQVILDTPGRGPFGFRAPYGVRWFGIGRAQRRLGLKGVMWTAMGYDWNLRAEAVVERMAGARVQRCDPVPARMVANSATPAISVQHRGRAPPAPCCWSGATN